MPSVAVIGLDRINRKKRTGPAERRVFAFEQDRVADPREIDGTWPGAGQASRLNSMRK